MYDNIDPVCFLERINELDAGTTIGLKRALAVYSAAVALADEVCQKAAIELVVNVGGKRSDLYEIVLQSYLFLGYPRMLIAADFLNSAIPSEKMSSDLRPYSTEEGKNWYYRGEKLCREVYADNYELLKNRVESFAPDIFRWMVVEGYGKVLSRPALDPMTRELAIVASLIMDNRYKQLYSHIKGALNVGVPTSEIRQVVEDIGPAAGKGYTSACKIIAQLGDHR